MTANTRTSEFQKTVQILQDAAHKVRDGVNNVIEPEVKEARLAAHDSQRMLAILARRVTLLFGLSILVNTVALFAIYVAVR